MIVQLQNTVDETQALYEIGQAVSTVTSYDVMLQEIMERLQGNKIAPDVHQAILARIDVDEVGNPEWTEVIASWQVDGPSKVASGSRYYLPDLPLTPLWVNSPNDYVVVEDARTDARLPEDIRNGWLSSNLVARILMPLYVAGHWVGQLSLSWSKPRHFSELDGRIFRALMGQIATVVDNQRLFNEGQRLATIVRYHPDFIGSGTLDGKALYVNPKGLSMMGLPPDTDVRTMNIGDFYDAQDVDQMAEHYIPQALAKGSLTTQANLRTKKGVLIPVEQTIGINYTSDGEPISFSITMRDITERMRSQAALAKRATELQTVADVSQAASTKGTSQALLETVVNLAKTNFHLYHAQVYILDESSESLLLKAGTGDIGRSMVSEGRAIPLNQEQSFVSLAARKREGIIINDVTENPHFLPHPYLPKTKAEMAIPLLVGDTLLGVLDVQSDQRNYFTDEDLSIQTTLAAQVAVALQNARSFERSEMAVQELDALARRLTRKGWQDYLETTTASQVHHYDLTQELLLSGDESAFEIPDASLRQALTLQGETFGELILQQPMLFTEEAKEIIGSVATRLSSHLENLRLSEQAEAALSITENQAERLAALNALATDLNLADDIKLVYKVLLSQLNNIVGGDTTRIGILQNEDAELQMMAINEQGVVVYMDVVPTTQSRIRTALQSKQIVVSADASNSKLPTEESQFLVRQNLYSTMVAPLIVGLEVIGTIHVGSGELAAFGPREENLMTQVASLMSATIEKLRLLSETQTRADRERRVRIITDKIRRSPDQASILRVAEQEIGNMLGTSVSMSQLGTYPQLLTGVDKNTKTSDNVTDKIE
ncbi:MAG: GAF domain-containing protein [Chloroflexota bacterium]